MLNPRFMIYKNLLYEVPMILLTISWSTFFGILTSIMAFIYYMAMTKINVVDAKFEGSWLKFFQSIFK